MRIEPSWMELRERSQSILPWEDTTTYQSAVQKKALTKTQLYWHLDLNFQPPDCEKQISVIFNQTSLWYFVIATSVQSLSHVWLFMTPWIARLPCSSPTTEAWSNSSGWWYHPIISSSVVPFSSCLQSCPASGFFPMSQFASGDQSIGVSASASVLPMNIWTDFL